MIILPPAVKAPTKAGPSLSPHSAVKQRIGNCGIAAGFCEVFGVFFEMWTVASLHLLRQASKPSPQQLKTATIGQMPWSIVRPDIQGDSRIEEKSCGASGIKSQPF
jgi:hypothetical protein